MTSRKCPVHILPVFSLSVLYSRLRRGPPSSILFSRFSTVLLYKLTISPFANWWLFNFWKNCLLLRSRCPYCMQQILALDPILNQQNPARFLPTHFSDLFLVCAGRVFNLLNYVHVFVFSLISKLPSDTGLQQIWIQACMGLLSVPYETEGL
jgi:hypothetical protein